MRRVAGAATRRFAGRSAILIVDTGQSNALGNQVATAPTPYDSRVHFLAATGRYGAGPQSTDHDDFKWINPGPTDPSITDYVTLIDVPYVGHLLGGKGKSAQQLAYRIANEEDVDVYVISACSGGSFSSRWGPGAIGLVRILLDDFVPHFIANTPALLAEGITAPDIVSWRQGETDAVWPVTPLEYNDIHTAIRAAAVGTWNGPDTIWLLGEPTQYWNWTGPSPVRWEGINAVARYGGEKIIFVPSVGLPAVSGNEIHFTGDGNVGYGDAMFSALYGYAPAKGAHSTEVRRGANPILGGPLDCDGYGLVDVDHIDAATATLTGALAAAFAAITRDACTSTRTDPSTPPTSGNRK